MKVTETPLESVEGFILREWELGNVYVQVEKPSNSDKGVLALHLLYDD